MFTHPLTLSPLLALGVTLVWTVLRPGAWPATLAAGSGLVLVGMLAHRAAEQQRREARQLAQLAQRGSELQAALERAEAARTAAQAEARTLEERYALALRGSQDGLWEWDLGGAGAQLSPRWKGMLGYAPHELADSAAAWRGRVHPDDLAAFDSMLARHADGAGGERFEHELRLLHKDGSVRWVLSRGLVLRRDGSALPRVVGMDADITRVRRMQTMLEEVAAGTAAALDERFFPALVEHLAKALNVGCAFITECVDTPATRLRTLAFWSDGMLRENFEYALPGSPCAEVVAGRRACFHREGLSALFPRERGYEAYLGMPIIGSDDRLLGHLAFLHKAPLGDEMLVEPVFRIFLARAAAEIERVQARRATD